MPPNLLLLPLLGGYCFLHFCYYYKFRAQRLDGYRLLLEAALAGCVLAALSRLMILGLKFIVLGPALQSAWVQFSPFPFSGTAVVALLAGIVFAKLTNLIWNEEKAKSKVLERHGNALFQLLHAAASKRRPIAVTLDTRKWYMGFVRDSPNLDPQEQYFALIPILSGYRSQDTLAVTETVFYDIAYDDGLNKNDFAVILPLASIKTAGYFDKDVWNRYFASKVRKRTARRHNPASG